MESKFISAYGKKTKVNKDCGPQSRTKQQFHDECDINKIMKKYHMTGVIDNVYETAGQFKEVPAMDFQQAMDIVANAKSQFELLPSNIRQKFENNPGKLMKFMQDDKNIQEARELGLIAPENTQEPRREAQTAKVGKSTGKAEKAPQEAEKASEGEG